MKQFRIHRHRIRGITYFDVQERYFVLFWRDLVTGARRQDAEALAAELNQVWNAQRGKGAA